MPATYILLLLDQRLGPNKTNDGFGHCLIASATA
jgi:hypothetical protein